MTRRAVWLACAAAAVAAGWGAWAWMRPLPVPRNVLLITLDTLRADRVGSYGSPKGLTPRLDALARQGARFARAYSPVPLTGPSHATMLTGLYPRSHGLMNNGTQVLSADRTLLSEILKDRGYRTAAIVSALVLASSFGLNQGWDLYYEEDIAGKGEQHGLWYDQRRGDKTVDRAITWLKGESDRPFFLWVHLFDPHDPYEPPSPFKEKYADAPYDGEVAFADAQVGRLLDALRDQGHDDDTLIVAVADHGEGLGDHGERFHALFLYDTTTRVPLIVRAPGAPRGVVVEDLASTLDVTPTILDALRIEGPQMQGVSLIGAAAARDRVPARPILLETIYPSASYGWAAVRAMVRPAWKLIDLPEPELYDLDRDPGEAKNLHGAEPARASDLRSEYDRLVAEVESTAPEVETAAIDDETRDRLISLGYIGGVQSTGTTRIGPDPKKLAFLIAPMKVAMEFQKKKLYDDAMILFGKTLEVDPDNRMALLQMARSLAASGRLDEAVKHFEHAIEVYPDVEEFYRVYGTAYLAAERYDRAEAVFKTALAALPESSHLHYLLGLARFGAGNLSGAEEEIDLAIKLNPRPTKPWFFAAICRLRRGDETGALAALEEYLRRYPDAESILRDPRFAAAMTRPSFQALIKKYL